MCSMATATSEHPFQRSGCGTAPFRYVGYAMRVGPIKMVGPGGVTMECGSPGQPMGTCDHCGMGIKDCYIIKDVNGKEFEVGCVCVEKLSRSDNAKRDPLIAAVKRAANAVKRERKAITDRTRIAQAMQVFEANRHVFEAIDASLSWKKQTKADQIDWYFANAGTAGKIKMAIVIEKEIGR